ncbi:MAG: glycoside hydrolase [Actinomycetota bacterium]|nr:glycoside hydrolase [Actinomycetota bacterium]
MTRFFSKRPTAVGLALAALLAVSTVAPQARGADPGGTGVRDASGGSATAQTEQTLAVNPRNPNNVLIGFISGLSVSHDGGRTWRLDPNRVCSGDGNPTFDQSGIAYVECGGDGVNIQVYRSPDGGDTWLGPISAASESDNFGDFIDRPWLGSGGRGHRLVVGWESFFTNPAGWVLLKTSSDGGLTWGPPRRVDDPLTARAAWDPRQKPVVGADGTIYVAYASGNAPFVLPQTVPVSFVVARSDDGGITFHRVVAALDVTRSTSPTEESESISSVAADPSPRRARHLALAWADERSGHSRTLVVTSTDGGLSWSSPTEVAPQYAGSPDQQDHPAIAFGPDGRLFVVWRDRSCCAGTWSSPYELFGRALFLTSHGPVGFGRIVKVTDQPQQPNSSSSLDEYLGVAVGVEGLSVAWNQPRNGTAASSFRRLPLASFG